MQKRKWHVLIVDDELRIGSLINKLIHWDKFNMECVDVVDNGEKALEIIQSERCPNIVLTDIRMPKISGLDLIRMTREHHKKIKFIRTDNYDYFNILNKKILSNGKEY